MQRVADDYKAECYVQKKMPQVKEFAARLRMPVPKLSRTFLSTIGVRPSVYFKEGQIERVKECLISTDLSLEAIAEITGFANVTTLSRSFRRITGMTPGAFRARYRHK